MPSLNQNVPPLKPAQFKGSTHVDDIIHVTALMDPHPRVQTSMQQLENAGGLAVISDTKLYGIIIQSFWNGDLMKTEKFYFISLVLFILPPSTTSWAKVYYRIDRDPSSNHLRLPSWPSSLEFIGSINRKNCSYWLITSDPTSDMVSSGMRLKSPSSAAICPPNTCKAISAFSMTG